VLDDQNAGCFDLCGGCRVSPKQRLAPRRVSGPEGSRVEEYLPEARLGEGRRDLRDDQETMPIEEGAAVDDRS